jgi:hypothetical protein
MKKAPASAVKDERPGRCITESKSRWSGKDGQTGRQSRHQATEECHPRTFSDVECPKGHVREDHVEGDHIAMEGEIEKVKAGC